MYETCPTQQRSLLALNAPNFLRGPFSWAWSKRWLSHLDIGVTACTGSVGEGRDVWILATWHTGWWFQPSCLKYESQWERLSHTIIYIYICLLWKRKNVWNHWNHQPAQVLLRAAAGSKKQSPTKNHGWLYKVVPKRSFTLPHFLGPDKRSCNITSERHVKSLFFFNEYTGPIVFFGRNPFLTIQGWYPCNIPYILHHITLILDTFLINLWFVLFKTGSSCTKVAQHSPIEASFALLRSLSSMLTQTWRCVSCLKEPSHIDGRKVAHRPIICHDSSPSHGPSSNSNLGYVVLSWIKFYPKYIIVFNTPTRKPKMNRFDRKPGSLRRCLISGQDDINIASVHFVQPIRCRWTGCGKSSSWGITTIPKHWPKKTPSHNFWYSSPKKSDGSWAQKLKVVVGGKKIPATIALWSPGSGWSSLRALSTSKTGVFDTTSTGACGAHKEPNYGDSTSSWAVEVVATFQLYQWIGLRENLQETHGFYHQI